MLTPTKERRDYRTQVRSSLERSGEQDGWRRLAAIDALGLLVPAEHGGSGASVADAAVVAEELGRVLLPLPYLSSAVTAARLLAGLDGTGPLLAGIASGESVATVAFLDAAGRWSPDGVTATATPAGAGWRLTGQVAFVSDAERADLLLVIAAGPDGLGVFRPDGPVRTVALDCLDPTWPLSRVHLDDVPATRLGVGTDLRPVLADMVATTIACACAAAVGSAERCLELSTEYATTRVQFGRPIGAFQAIKHRCADMFIALESARSAVHALLDDLDRGLPETALDAAIAKAVSSDALLTCAQSTIQIHGGIGFTWEHAAHHYLRRAMAHAHLFGDAVHHRAQVARLAGIG